MKPFLVVIAGGTASGKTTLARRLESELGALLITHDRYYCDIPHPRGFNFDHPDALDTPLLESHVAALLAGFPAELPVYAFATHSRQVHTERVESQPLIVVEGILVMHSEMLVHAADLLIYVDAPDDIRLTRRIRRDVAERGRTIESVLDQYLETVRPMHLRYVEPTRKHAHLVVDGLREPSDILEQVIQEVRHRQNS